LLGHSVLYKLPEQERLVQSPKYDNRTPGYSFSAPEIPFVTLKVISGYKTETQNKNNYSETKETFLLVSKWNKQLPRDCRVGREDPVYLPSGSWWRRYTWRLF
jgi:hypothetical protein